MAAARLDGLAQVARVAGQFPEQTAGFHAGTLRVAQRGRTQRAVGCHHVDVLIEAGAGLVDVFLGSLFVACCAAVLCQGRGCDGCRAVRALVGPQIRPFPRQPAGLRQLVTGPYALVPGLFGCIVIGLVAGCVVHLEQGDNDPAGVVGEIVAETRRTAPVLIAFVVVTALIVPFLEIALDTGFFLGIGRLDTVVVLYHGSHGVCLLPVVVGIGTAGRIVFPVREHAFVAIAVFTAVEALDESRGAGVRRLSPIDRVGRVLGVPRYFFRLGKILVFLFRAGARDGCCGKGQHGNSPSE